MLVTDIIGTKGISNNENVEIPLSALVTISKGQDFKTIIAAKLKSIVPLLFAPEGKEKDMFVNRIQTL